MSCLRPWHLKLRYTVLLSGFSAGVIAWRHPHNTVHLSGFIRADATPQSKKSYYDTGQNFSATTIKHVSAGCLSGFASGMALTCFFKTILLTVCMLVISIKIALSFGLKLPQSLEIRRLRQTSIWKTTRNNPMFIAPFVTTFGLAAFGQFQ